MADETPLGLDSVGSTSYAMQSNRRAIRDEIAQKLLQASEKDVSYSRNRFVPRGALVDIIDRQNVEQLLSTLLCQKKETSVYLAQVASEIAPDSEEPCCCCKHGHCTGGRMILAALLLCGKEHLILSIFASPKSEVCDDHLPIRFDEDGNPQDLPEEYEDSSHRDEGESLRHTSPFQGLDKSEKDLFEYFQWQVFTPYLVHLGLNHGRGYVTYPEEVSLPWSGVEGQRSPVEGQVSFVERVTMYPQSHSLLSGQDSVDSFALKVFDEEVVPGLAEDRFQREIHANQYLPKHHRVVPLLSAFKHRGKFHLLFPWADGGNLREMWRSYDPAKTDTTPWYSDKWLIEESFGLADALAVVHGQHIQLPQTNALLHADIKPDNILCFSNGNSSHPGMFLKLADFGEAKEVEPGTALKPREHGVVHVKTYRPPEYSANADIFPNYDVWCLGCLFMEFVTWAILGWPGVQAFCKSRESEQDDDEVTEVPEQLTEDVFFKRVGKIRKIFPWTDIKMGWRTKTRVRPAGTTMQYIAWVSHPIHVGYQVKDKVVEYFRILKNNESCPDALKRFLEFIQEKMLVVDTRQRADSWEVREFLRTLLEDPQLMGEGSP